MPLYTGRSEGEREYGSINIARCTIAFSDIRFLGQLSLLTIQIVLSVGVATKDNYLYMPVVLTN